MDGVFVLFDEGRQSRKYKRVRAVSNAGGDFRKNCSQRGRHDQIGNAEVRSKRFVQTSKVQNLTFATKSLDRADLACPRNLPVRVALEDVRACFARDFQKGKSSLF